MTQWSQLPYNPQKLSRELNKFYIAATESEKNEMLKTIGLSKWEDLFSHINSNLKFQTMPFMTEGLAYGELIAHMENLSKKNKIKTSFIGDGLKTYRVPEIVPFVCSLRGLTTAYTPYQPERSQGTLQTLWIYASTLSQLTGFEAINASFYDRSTCLYEAINTAMRIQKGATIALVCESIYPQDIEVLKTHAQETNIQIITVAIDPQNGRTDIEDLKQKLNQYKGQINSITFPQVNNFGNLEDVNLLTDLAREHQIQSIAMIDPMLLATEGLLPPSQFGSNQLGAHMIVGEGQHLCLGPNYGGPGLGIFGIRFNESNKNDIRQTAGRFVGKTKDADGKDALCMVLSTREQHIRREKATSNICSNQSFVATIAGAAILARGESGMTEAMLAGRDYAQQMAHELTQFAGVSLAFAQTPFFNEFTLEIDQNKNIDELISKASQAGIHLGVNVSGRVKGKKRNLLLVSFFDTQTDEDLDLLVNFFAKEFQAEEKDLIIPEIPQSLMRDASMVVGLPEFDTEELKDFYTKLSNQNVSPDDSIYPLGSCTMKYNPYINDYAASLKGFTDIHPQAPIEDAQGSLEILFEIQEIFKRITGLAGVVTQPVAGAQGELVGLKMFQAYHRRNGEAEKRNILLIPRSAHGTNPATATMAGYETKIVDGQNYGIVTVEAGTNGEVNFDQFKELVEKYQDRIAGMMATNPNTSGIFETRFKEMADLVHKVGGLVYMDGANMNAIAGIVNLDAMGVDAVHNNLHKTWSIPHGGGGPGDGIVAVSSKLVDFIPGIQVKKEGDKFVPFTTKYSIGHFHRHVGNFAHKVRAYTYLKALGSEGIIEMSKIAVLSARYLYQKLNTTYPTLPEGALQNPRMHEFILTISPETFDRIAKAGTPKASAVAKIGKLFLDFGLHAPTVAFPEIYGLMIEPTESFSKAELDRFVDVVNTIGTIINENPEVLTTAPHFTPVKKVDEVEANKTLQLNEKITKLPTVYPNRLEVSKLHSMSVKEIYSAILKK